MLFFKILVAYDGSELGEKALRSAVELAQSNNLIQIEVLHVVAPFPYLEYYVPSENDDQMLMEQGRQTLNSAEETLSGIQNPWSTTILLGHPAAQILDFAKVIDCDLIVMGSRGLSGLKELFLGSVSHNVVQHAPVPVLIIK